MNSKERKEQIERLILSYLRRNPDASDTLEGITKWWLKLEKINSSVEEVAEACEKLIKMGRLKKYNKSSGLTHYRFDGEEKNSRK